MMMKLTFRAGRLLLALAALALSDGIAHAAPVGSNFQVNTQQQSGQRDQSAYNVAALKNGGFVAVWGEGNSVDLKGQRFDAAHQRVGTEFRINDISRNTLGLADVAGLNGGDYVIVWSEKVGDKVHIVGSLYDDSTGKRTKKFQVSTTPGERPSVAAINSGRFVVTWISGTAIKGQVLNSLGQKVGAEFKVNSTYRRGLWAPQVTYLRGGGFVIAWTSLGANVAGNAIYLRRYNSNGQPLAGEYRAAATQVQRDRSSIAGLTDGSFVLTWRRGSAGFGQRYNATGGLIGGQFQITPGGQLFKAIAVAALKDGGFVVSFTDWDEGEDDGEGIFARRYNAAGTAVGDQFRVNDAPLRDQNGSQVTGLEDGGFVAIWTEDDGDFCICNGRDGLGLSVFGQRYNSAP